MSGQNTALAARDEVQDILDLSGLFQFGFDTSDRLRDI
jgi:hypothetical protein